MSKLLPLITSAHPQVQIGDINGCATPIIVNGLKEEVRAIRHTAAVSVCPYITCIEVGGDARAGFLERCLPCDLEFRPGKIRHTLLIRSASFELSDCYVIYFPDKVLLLLDGLPPQKHVDWLQSQVKVDEDVWLRPLNGEFDLLSLTGPFAWEVLAEVFEPGIISLPLFTHCREDSNIIICRMGETGEFGYKLLVPQSGSRILWRKITRAGERFGLGISGFEAWSYTCLENFFFNPHREGKLMRHPAELQLQNRVSYTKEFVHSAALGGGPPAPLKQRLTAFVSRQLFGTGEKLFSGANQAGVVVQSGANLNGPGAIGLAMSRAPYIYPDLVLRTSGGAEVRTVSAPFVNNRSLSINPQIHSFAGRAEISFPPVFRERGL